MKDNIFEHIVSGPDVATAIELVDACAREYADAAKKQKGVLLDDLCAMTGWSRVNARRRIRQVLTGGGPGMRRPRAPKPRKYSDDAMAVLAEVWAQAGRPCGKYLAAVMDDTVDRLLRFGELEKVATLLNPRVLDEVKAMSPATIDRYLRPIRAEWDARAEATADFGDVFLASVPLRTMRDEFPGSPGYLVIDTVPHSGGTAQGEYLATINATDPHTGWGVIRTVKSEASVHMTAGMHWIVAHYPVPLKGIDFRTEPERAHPGLIEWCDQHRIPTIPHSGPRRRGGITRDVQRPDDQSRSSAFRRRYETDTELTLFNQLWPLVMARKNHLLPCVKTIGWDKTSTGHKKRVYDKPLTPYQRLTDTGLLDGAAAHHLAAEHERLNPAAITRTISTIQAQLADSAHDRARQHRESAVGDKPTPAEE